MLDCKVSSRHDLFVGMCCLTPGSCHRYVEHIVAKTKPEEKDQRFLLRKGEIGKETGNLPPVVASKALDEQASSPKSYVTCTTIAREAHPVAPLLVLPQRGGCDMGPGSREAWRYPPTHFFCVQPTEKSQGPRPRTFFNLLEVADS